MSAAFTPVKDSMARFQPGTATGDFSILLSDLAGLDADLQVEQHDRRVVLLDGLADLAAGANANERGICGVEGRSDLFEEAIGVGRHDDGRHDSQGSRGVRRHRRRGSDRG